MPQSNGSADFVDLYLRISQDRTGEGAAHDRQEKDCRALAKRLGKTVRHVYVDTDSAYGPKRKRPGFESLLAGRPPAVITHHTDRSWREPADLERVIALDVNVYAFHAGHLDLSTPGGRATARTLVAWAKYEMELKGQRQQDANRQRAEAGQPWRAGRRAFGYLPDYSEINESEAAFVRGAFRDLLAGVSLRTIARRWNEAGARTTRDNPWTTAALRIVLRNPTYAGRRRLNGVEVADLKGVPPIIDRDTFAAVQVVLGDPARLTSDRGGRGPVHLLSGVARCGVEVDGRVCGAKLSAGSATSRGRSWRVWRCIEGLHLSRKAEPIEKLVVGYVLARLRRPDARKLLAVERPDLRPLQRRATELRAQRATLAADLDVDLDFATARDRRLRDELTKVEAEIVTASAGSALAAFASGRDPDEVWAELDLDARREAIRELVHVEVLQAGRGYQSGFDRRTVRITPRKPA